MDAVSQLHHYGTLNTKPAPPTATSDTPPKKPPNANLQPTNAYVGSTLTNETPNATMSDNNWPDAPVQVTATPPPITPYQPPNIPPIDSLPNPVHPGSGSSHHFPLMIATMLIMVALVGFGGSFLYFKSKGTSQRAFVAPQITPPVSIIPTEIVIEPTLNANPFAPTDSTASANPFAQDEESNPFDNAASKADATQAAYTNPFDETK